MADSKRHYTAAQVATMNTTGRTPHGVWETAEMQVKAFKTEEDEQRLLTLDQTIGRIMSRLVTERAKAANLRQRGLEEEAENYTARNITPLREEVSESEREFTNIHQQIERRYIDHFNGDAEAIFADIKTAIDAFTIGEFRKFVEVNRVRFEYLNKTAKALTNAEITDKPWYEPLLEETPGAIKAFLVKALKVQLYAYDVFKLDKTAAVDLIESTAKKKCKPKRAAAQTDLATIPDTLTLFTAKEARNALTSSNKRLNQIGYVVAGVASREGFKIDEKGKVQFNDKSQDFETRPIDSEPFLAVIASIVDKQIEKTGDFNSECKVSIRDIAQAIGDAKISETSNAAVLDHFDRFQNYYGVLLNHNTIPATKAVYKFLTLKGYDEATKTLIFDSPYLSRLYELLYNSNPRLIKGTPAINPHNGLKEPLKPFKTNIASMKLEKEKNKRAVLIICNIGALVASAGKTPRVKAATLVEECPELYARIADPNIPNKIKNRDLERCFSKVLEILNEEEDRAGLRRTYKNIKIPKTTPKNIPKVDTLDTLIYEFTNEGKKRKTDKEKKTDEAKA